jgi:O-antigen/teichoic acid export membrane protein
MLGTQQFRAWPRLPERSDFSVLQDAIPFWVANASFQLRTLDTLLVSLIAGPHAAGIYALPARASQPFRLLPTMLNSLTIPVVASRHRPTIAGLVKLMRLASGLVAFGVLVLAIFAEEIVGSIFGSEYREAVLPLRIVCCGILVSTVGSFRSSMLQGLGDERYVAKIGVVLVFVTLSLVAFGAALLGAVGAALAVTFSYCVQFLLVWIRKPQPRGAVT